jgi:hypothetical protein
VENGRLRKALADLALEKVILKGTRHFTAPWGNFRVARVVEHVATKLGLSGWLSCKMPGPQRKAPTVPDDEAALRDKILAQAKLHGRYGYRRLTALLRVAGWCTSHKRLECIGRHEGVKLPRRQPKRGRVWLNGGLCIWLRPCWRGRSRPMAWYRTGRTTDGVIRWLS